LYASRRLLPWRHDLILAISSEQPIHHSYYVLAPEDIFALAGGRSVISVRFLEFLLYQAEMKRRQEVRGTRAPDYKIRLQSEVMAHWLRLDGLLASRQKMGLRETLYELYMLGAKVGFLQSFDFESAGSKHRRVDVLKLNKEKFEEFWGVSSLLPTVARSNTKVRKV
jgi:hypothetical protein